MKARELLGMGTRARVMASTSSRAPDSRRWPRSNSTRRNVFQTDLVEAFADADRVVVAEVARLEQVPPDERLDPARLMQDLQARGKSAAYLPDADAIVAHVKKEVSGGDVDLQPESLRPGAFTFAPS